MNLSAALRTFEGPPPAFLVKGLRMTATGGPVVIARLEQERAGIQHAQDMALTSAGLSGPTAGGVQCVQEPQEAQNPMAGPPILPEPVSPVLALSPPQPAAIPELLAPGVGARLHAESKTLARARGVPIPSLAPLALEPAGGPMLLRGVATRTEIDETRTMLLPNALHWNALPPLRLKHGEICGEILSLEYHQLGSELIIECRADAEAAPMPAFSVAFTPEAWKLVDHGGQNFYFAVTKARLDEVSLTDIPALRSALVQVRTEAPPALDSRYQALAGQLARLRLTLAA